MSGIAGIYNLDGRPVDPALLRRMTAVISHRGPDGVGHWIDGPVGLGHQMLCTTPESLHEKQPLLDETGNLCLTLDGRVDNRDELKTAIEAKGGRVRDDTDAELVLKSYECWGEECPKRILGDFAFVIWDKRRHRVFCARDHMGCRPFYYYKAAGLFVFASEIKAILFHKHIPRLLNESRIVDYFVPEIDREDAEGTFYRGICRLPAGHKIDVGVETFKLEDYWQLKAPTELRLRSLDAYGEAFKDIFVEAVRCRLRSSVKLGATLSGGLDSSSVVCTIREIFGCALKGDLSTFSAVSADDLKCGETPFIKAVLNGGKVEPHIVRSDQVNQWIHNLEPAMANNDEPFELSGGFMLQTLLAKVRSTNVDVLLDGVDGDLPINPRFEYFAHLLSRGKLKMLYSEVNALSKSQNLSRGRVFKSYALVPLFPRTYLWIRRILKGGIYPGPDAYPFLNSQFAHHMKVSERLLAVRRKYWSLARRVGELHLLNINSGVIQFALEISDQSAASFSIEPRHPFLDIRLIQFCLTLPLWLKIQTPFAKLIIRNAMAGILPEQVRWRTTYAHPGRDFMYALIAMSRELLKELFIRKIELLQRFVNATYLRMLYRGFYNDGNVEDGVSLWTAVNLAVWLEAKGLTI